MSAALYDGAAARAIDRRAIDGYSIAGHELMARAGRAVADVVAARMSQPAAKVSVVCGKGNNAGDGYIAAEALQTLGYEVEAIALADPGKLQGDAAWAYGVWKNAAGRTVDGWQTAVLWSAQFETTAIVIDAIFGTGYRGGMPDAWQVAIAAIVNVTTAKRIPVYAIDLPSGVVADSGEVPDVAMRASQTLTIGFEKIGPRIWPGRGFAGDIRCLDIGYPEGAFAAVEPKAALLGPEWAALFRAADDAHKGTNGIVVAIGGSVSMPGALALTARAALRAGAGRVFAYSECGGHTALDPEAMRLGGDTAWENVRAKDVIDVGSAVDALVIGPGLGRHAGRLALVADLLQTATQPVVLDADALYALPHLDATAMAKSLLERLVITPHAGEAAFLLQTTAGHVQAKRLEAAEALATRFGCTVVLKGAGTIVYGGGNKIAVSPVASAALAVPGSGDVLAGVIGALLARGNAPYAAACAGVWAHGETSRHLPQVGNLAREIADALPRAISATWAKS